MVDLDILSVDEFSVQMLDGLIGFRVARHFNKPETLRLSRTSVADDFAAFDLAEGDKHFFQDVHGDAGSDVTDINIHEFARVSLAIGWMVISCSINSRKIENRWWTLWIVSLYLAVNEMVHRCMTVAPLGKSGSAPVYCPLLSPSIAYLTVIVQMSGLPAIREGFAETDFSVDRVF
jgi:hypothetical protein